MKTHSEIVRSFYDSADALEARGLTVKSDGEFIVFRGDEAVFSTPTVDGLAGYVAGTHLEQA